MYAHHSAGVNDSGVCRSYPSCGYVRTVKNKAPGFKTGTVHQLQKLRSFLIFLLFFIGFRHFLPAQPFPVTSIVQVTRFSPYLEDYTDPGRVVVTLISTDTREAYPALIRLRFSGSGFLIRTRPDFLPPPIELRRNQPLVLTGSGLWEYFLPDNLDFGGLSLDQIMAGGGQLPDGPLSFCVEVFDYNRFFDPPVSNTGCAQGMITLHRPPVLLEPSGEVEAVFPQQLRFAWQPQHAGLAAEYTLELYENHLPGFGYDVALTSSAPLFSGQTFAAFYLYGPADPLLREGTAYLVRVRARDPAGQAAFVNDGWSEVRSFIYRNTCLPPVNPDWRPVSDSSVLLTWLPAAGGRKQWLSLGPAPPQSTAQGGRNQQSGNVELPADTNAHTLNGLIKDLAYQVNICTECAGGTTACTSFSLRFNGLDAGDCPGALPPDLQPVEIRSREVTLAWTMQPGVTTDTFYLAWKPDETQDYGPEAVVAGAGFEVRGLDPLTPYSARLCYQCPDGALLCDTIRFSTRKAGCEIGPLAYTYACGDSTVFDTLDDAPMLTDISPGDSVWAGDYLVILDQITGRGPYFGRGHLQAPYLNMAHLSVKLVGIEVNENCRMARGYMEVAGAGVELIGGQWADVLGDILDGVGALEEILAASEEILTAINEILVEMGPHLPDSISLNLQAAQAALAAAQQQYDAALASGDPVAVAQAEAALQQAMAQVQAANAAFQEALNELMEDLLGLVGQAIDGIMSECPDLETLEQDFNSKGQALEETIQEELQQLEVTGGSGVEDFIILEETVEELEADSLEFSPDLVARSDTFYQQEMQFMTCTAFSKLKTEIVSPAALTELATVLLETGFNLVDFVAPMLQNGQPAAAIVAALQGELRGRVGEMLVKRGYGG